MEATLEIALEQDELVDLHDGGVIGPQIEFVHALARNVPHTGPPDTEELAREVGVSFENAQIDGCGRVPREDFAGKPRGFEERQGEPGFRFQLPVQKQGESRRDQGEQEAPQDVREGADPDA